MSHNLAGAPPYRAPGALGPADFKPPLDGPAPLAPAPGNPKKRRKTAAALAPQPPPTVQDLLPPPLSGYGDTVVASNPFDDSPPQHNGPHNGPHGVPNGPMMHMMGGPPRHLSPLHMGMGGMGGPPRSGIGPMGMGMGGMGSGGMSPHAMHGGHAPMPMHGGASPMPHGHARSMGSPMSGPLGSPMNAAPAGSPMSGGPLGSPMNANGPMGPPMHSPLGNGPANGPPGGGPMGPGPRANGPMGALPCPNGSVPPNGPGGGPMSGAPGHCGPMRRGSPLDHNGPGPGAPYGSPHHGMGPNGPMGVGPGHPVHGGPMGCGPLANMSNMAAMGGPNSQGMPMNHQMGPMGGMGPQMGMFGPKPMPVSAGKIYPPDQPMVFNPQNPNAPPIYPCGVCHKEVHDNDQAILCESGCNFWFHRGCTGLTEPAFQLLTAEVYAEWVCDKCLSSKNIPLVKFKP